MDELMKLMKKRASEMKAPMSDAHKAARMGVLHELKGMMNQNLGKDLPEVARMKADSQSGGLDASKAKMPGDKVGAGMYDSNDQHKQPIHMVGARVMADSPEHLKEGLQHAESVAGKIPDITASLKKAGLLQGDEAKHNMKPDVNDDDHAEFDDMNKDESTDESDDLGEDPEHEASEPHAEAVAEGDTNEDTEESLAAEIKRLEAKRKNLATKKTFRY